MFPFIILAIGAIAVLTVSASAAGTTIIGSKAIKTGKRIIESAKAKKQAKKAEEERQRLKQQKKDFKQFMHNVRHGIQAPGACCPQCNEPPEFCFCFSFRS